MHTHIIIPNTHGFSKSTTFKTTINQMTKKKQTFKITTKIRIQVNEKKKRRRKKNNQSTYIQGKGKTMYTNSTEELSPLL